MYLNYPELLTALSPYYSIFGGVTEGVTYLQKANAYVGFRCFDWVSAVKSALSNSSGRVSLERGKTLVRTTHPLPPAAFRRIVYNYASKTRIKDVVVGGDTVIPANKDGQVKAYSIIQAALPPTKHHALRSMLILNPYHSNARVVVTPNSSVLSGRMARLGLTNCHAHWSEYEYLVTCLWLAALPYTITDPVPPTSALEYYAFGRKLNINNKLDKAYLTIESMRLALSEEENTKFLDAVGTFHTHKPT